MAFPAQADALPVVDSRRDLDVELALLDEAPCAVAALAGPLDDRAGPAAARAAVRADELAERAAGDLLDVPGPLARRARDRLRAGLGPGADAPLARSRDAERHLPLGAGRRLDELDLDLGGYVRATRPLAGTHSAARE